MSKFLLQVRASEVNMEKGLIFRVSETGLMFKYACTYRLGLFRVDKGHFGLAPKPKYLSLNYSQRKVAADFPRNLKKLHGNFHSFLPIFL